jgi:hypothetical protein
MNVEPSVAPGDVVSAIGGAVQVFYSTRIVPLGGLRDSFLHVRDPLVIAISVRTMMSVSSRTIVRFYALTPEGAGWVTLFEDEIEGAT